MRARIVGVSVTMSISMIASALAFLALPLDVPPAYRPRGGSIVSSRLAIPRAAAETASVEPALSSPAEPRVGPRAPRRRAPVPSRDDLDLFPAPPPVPPTPLTNLPPGLRPELDRVPCTVDRLDGSIGEAVGREGTVSDVLFLLGARRQVTADFASAADYYEAFALHAPEADGAECSAAERALGTCPDAPRALERAIAFRHALGDINRAVELADVYVDTYGETRIADAARVSLEAGRFLLEEHRNDEAIAHYRRHTQRFARHVRPAEAVRAWVERGRAEWTAGERNRASRSFRRALLEWRRGRGDEVALAIDPEGDGSGADFARALDAVAEAGYHLAELRYEHFHEIDAPGYAGDGTPVDVQRWVARRLRPWVVQKARALASAEAAYVRVAELGSTRFRVAAEARTGEMYHEMMESFRRAPLPEVRVETERETLVARADWRAAPIERLRGGARDAFRRCLDAAIRSRQFGRDASLCAIELDRVAAEPHGVEIVPRRARLHEPSSAPRPLHMHVSPEACSDGAEAPLTRS